MYKTQNCILCVYASISLSVRNARQLMGIHPLAMEFYKGTVRFLVKFHVVRYFTYSVMFRVSFFWERHPSIHDLSSIADQDFCVL